VRVELTVGDNRSGENRANLPRSNQNALMMGIVPEKSGAETDGSLKQIEDEERERCNEEHQGKAYGRSPAPDWQSAKTLSCTSIIAHIGDLLAKWDQLSQAHKKGAGPKPTP
jgi:hypothetical protein